jgi:hypothetical protein
VGCEVAVARPARAARRELRPRSAGDEPGGAAGIRQAHGQHRASELRVLLAAARAHVRSRAGAAYVAAPAASSLNAAGIRTKLRTIERAAFFSGWAQKKYRGLILGNTGAFGNAATRIEPIAVASGTYAYGGYADIDGLFQEQASQLDPKRAPKRPCTASST